MVDTITVRKKELEKLIDMFTADCDECPAFDVCDTCLTCEDALWGYLLKGIKNYEGEAKKRKNNF